MKKNLTVVVALITLIIGLAIGYQIGKKPATPENPDTTNSGNAKNNVQKRNFSLNGMLEELSQNENKFFDAKSLSVSVRILGSHQVCQADYDAYKLAFWGPNPPAGVPTELAIDVQQNILDVVDPTACGFYKFVAFNPTAEKKMTDVTPICGGSVHDVKTSCYPRSTFDYLAWLQDKFGYAVTMTKGVKTIPIGGTPTAIRMIMFKIENPRTKTTAFYDIVDDPNNVIDPTGNQLACPGP